MRTLNDFVRCGKVRYIGVSNFASHHIKACQEVVRTYGLEPLVSLQPQYSLLCRSTEWDLLPVCEEEGLGVLPWSPLAGGWLSGRCAAHARAGGGGGCAHVWRTHVWCVGGTDACTQQLPAGDDGARGGPRRVG
jgi:aryl-alcohol dehydrogenase-like predicted oxidoreductase